ncbi:hypothetical protein FJZ19_04440 [Candidatus Pacearchaeota archaeon]|nr:hypothetical protein [Candidatus Pacearchaeota archaeon]
MPNLADVCHQKKDEIAKFIDFARANNIKGIFFDAETQTYYFVRLGYRFDEQFENKLVTLQKRTIGGDSPRIFCIPENPKGKNSAGLSRIY